MNQKTKTLPKIAPELNDLLNLVDELELPEDSGHHTYSTSSMLKL